MFFLNFIKKQNKTEASVCVHMHMYICVCVHMLLYIEFLWSVIKLPFQ